MRVQGNRGWGHNAHLYNRKTKINSAPKHNAAKPMTASEACTDIGQSV